MKTNRQVTSNNKKILVTIRGKNKEKISNWNHSTIFSMSPSPTSELFPIFECSRLNRRNYEYLMMLLPH